MATDGQSQLKTLWLWPTGHFPRRVIFYLKAKSLPATVLRSASNPNGELHINTIVVDMAARRLAPAQKDMEDRPKGCTLPTLRISANGQDHFIRQSSSILEYFEQYYPPSQGYVDLSGGSIEKHAFVRDIVQLVNEVIDYVRTDIRHTEVKTLLWSGLTKETMIREAGEDGRKQWKSIFRKLDGWVRPNIVDRNSFSLVGLDTPTLADISLAACVAFFRKSVDLDVLDGYEALTKWYQRFADSEFFVSQQELEMMEKEGFASLFRS